MGKGERMSLNQNIKRLVQYGIETGILPACEKIYAANLLLDLFREDEYQEPEEDCSGADLEEILGALLDEAVKRGIIEDSIGYREMEGGESVRPD